MTKTICEWHQLIYLRLNSWNTTSLLNSRLKPRLDLSAKRRRVALSSAMGELLGYICWMCVNSMADSCSRMASRERSFLSPAQPAGRSCPSAARPVLIMCYLVLYLRVASGKEEARKSVDSLFRINTQGVSQVDSEQRHQQLSSVFC